ncbi:MAG: ABC transporter substrate-binding protein [Paracoccus sp. (in: a-proteobacteria)]|nr:ABC transporter substrate-binding protein [Paracoccus sp. (in: a-proteobacteria)]
MKTLTLMSTAAVAALLAGPVLADIKIGASLSETGPAAFLGDPEAKTLRMEVERLNAAGGVNGEKINLIIYDDGGDANRAKTFATRLVEDDEVVAVIGGTTTGTTMAMIPVFEDAEIPFISLAGAVDIIEPVKPFTFKTPHTDRMACEKIFEDMKARGFSKVGLISGSDGFGQSMQAQCKSVAGDSGIEIVADEVYGPQDADMTPQLTNINARGVDAILNSGMGQGPAVVTRNHRQLAISAPLYQSHGVASKQFIELAGADAAEGVRLPAAALLVADQLADDDEQKPVVTAYRDAYSAATGEEVSTFGGHAHDALAILVAAIERAGGADDPVAIRDQIEATAGFVGTGGKVNFAPDDHLGLTLDAFRMLEIRGGDWTIVE